MKVLILSLNFIPLSVHFGLTLYIESFDFEGKIKLIRLPKFATNNAHMFYLVLPTIDIRTKLIEFLESNKMKAVFHYLPLHKSAYYSKVHDSRELPNSEIFANRLLRLPFYYELSIGDQLKVIECVKHFLEGLDIN